MKTRTILVALCLATISSAFAQEDPQGQGGAVAAPGQVEAVKKPGIGDTYEFEADRIPTVHTGGNVLIKHGRLLTVTHGDMEDTDVLIENGKIRRIGKGLTAPAGFTVIDATGKVVSPGIVDSHSHRGINAVNEGSDSITCETRIADVLNPQSDGLFYNLANGVTTMLSLHGSANSIGGESIVTKSKWRGTVADMIFDRAPRMVKFALGQNVRSAGGGRGQTGLGRFPSTRQGVEAVYRRAFDDAKAYMKLWDDYNRDPKSNPMPRKDVRLDTLSDILRRKIWVQCHSYRQDEMLMMVRLSQDYGFKLGGLQHGLEAYKIAPELAEAGIPVSGFAGGFSYKLEVVDSLPMQTSLLIRAGVLTAVNTDTESGLAPLQQDAAKALRYGISPNDALKTITMNAAKIIGVDKYVGSLDEGKDGDVAIWSGHPLSIYSRCEQTLIEGEVMFQRHDAFGLNAASHTQDDVHTTNLTADQEALPKWSDMYAIVNGTVHTVSGDVLQNATVIIRGNKIEAVGAHVSVPSGAVVVNAHGLQVYPGFVDGGSNLGLNEIGQVPESADPGEPTSYNPDLSAVIAMNPDAVRIAMARCAGITTAQVLPNGGIIAGRGSVIDLAGFNREQMLINKDGVLVVDWPAAPEGRRAQFAALLGLGGGGTSETDAQRAEIGDYFDTGKRYADARKADPNDYPVDRKLEGMVDFVSGKKPVIFRAESVSSIQSAIKFGKDHGLKVIIAGGGEAWRIGKEIADAGVPVLVTPPSMSCPDETSPAGTGDPYDTPFELAALLHNQGVKVGVMSGAAEQIYDLPIRVGSYCAHGLKREDALRMLTLGTAEILGVGDQVGSLSAGKIANVVIADADPMEISTQIKQVFIGGKPVALKSHFTDLYRKFEKRLKH